MLNVVKSLIQNKEKRFLLIRRVTDSKFFPGLFDFPGGKLEQGEEALAGVIRETEEETGLQIEPADLIGEYDYTEQNTEIHFQIFSVRKYFGEINLSSDHSEFGWFTEKELEQIDLAPIVKMYFKKQNADNY